jgi:hypothetical protein
MAAIAQDYTQPEPFEVPEGGLASFLTATTGEWAEATNDSHIPETGIAGVKQVADKLAQYGRYEDEYMVHAAEGETVIPAQVLDLNPRLKAKLFKEMRDMGLEPERYVVGSELNSINPVTGQPEFFIKKLFKSVKKAVKKVVKVFKKIAPVVLPFALNAVFPGMGTVLQGAIGSGLGTAIQGGNLKDVLKAATIGGAAGYIGGKITGAENIGPGENPFEINPNLTGGSTVTSDVVAQNVGATPATTPPSGALPPGGTSALDTSALVDPLGTAPAPAPTGTDFAAQAAQSSQQLQSVGVDPTLTGASQAQLADLGVTPEMQAQAASQTGAQVGTQASADLVGTAGQSLGETFGNIFRPESLSDFGSNLRELFMPTDINNLMTRLRDANPTKYLGEAGQELLEKEAATLLENAGRSVAEAGFMRTYAPAAIGITGLMGAAGGFETPEVQPLPDPYGGATGLSLLEQSRAMYAPGVFRYAANGGDVAFPRMNGAISGPGTETSDDIPAMLSDGEFVMTARAVRGAGNGDREAGMRRMYEIMNRFEGGAIRGS